MNELSLFCSQMKKTEKIRMKKTEKIRMWVAGVAVLTFGLLMDLPGATADDADTADTADLEEKLSQLQPHPLYRSLHQEHRRVLTLGEADALPNDVPPSAADDYADVDSSDLLFYGDAVTVSLLFLTFIMSA